MWYLRTIYLLNSSSRCLFEFQKQNGVSINIAVLVKHWIQGAISVKWQWTPVGITANPETLIECKIRIVCRTKNFTDCLIQHAYVISRLLLSLTFQLQIYFLLISILASFDIISWNERPQLYIYDSRHSAMLGGML